MDLLRVIEKYQDRLCGMLNIFLLKLKKNCCIVHFSLPNNMNIIAWQGPRSPKKIVEKLNLLHTFKAHHHILCQIFS